MLLFGPPGTSKTTFVRALAEKLEWRYIEISPSVFLGQGLEHIYGRTAEIFADLMDLSQVVVLFDEMDALGQTREEKENRERLDAVRQLLTTSMLPKLSALHDRKQVLFFMATNHREGLDPAIVRAGRFDILLHVRPPLWRRKLEHLEAFHKGEAADIKKSQEILNKWLEDKASLTEFLDIYTFDEIKSLLEHIRRIKSKTKTLSAALISIGESGFTKLVTDWAERSIILRKGQPLRKEFDEDQKMSRLQ